MLKVGQIETVEITGYTSEGLGVCRIDGCAVFVPNAIRGEVCEVAVSYVSRNSAQAKIRKLLRVSPHRVNRLCPDAKRCGGCQLHHMDYAEELYFKAQKVTDALNRLGGQALDLVPITGGDGVRLDPAWDAARDSAPVGAHTRAPASSAPVGAHTVRLCSPVSLPLEGKVASGVSRKPDDG